MRTFGQPTLSGNHDEAHSALWWRALVLFLLAVTFSTAIARAQPVQGGTLPGPLPLLPTDNWWNTDISSAPIDSNSSSFIGFIGTTRALHPDFGGDSGVSNPLTYGMPYCTVSGTQTLVPVTFDYADESDYQAPGRPPGYPIPNEVKTQTRWIEGGLAGNDPNANGDRHLLIVDRDNRILFELYALRWNTSMNRWEAGSGAIFPLDTNLRRPDGWTSADAAGLAILPGLVRYDESYASTDPIRHAFRVTVRSTNGYVYPASHRAGSTTGALPMGARLRLKASKDISGFPAELRRIFQAMKTYGLIVADNGSDMYITGTYDIRWNNDILNPAFRSLTASDFEIVQLGWKPGTTPPPPPTCNAVTITMQPAGASILSGKSTTLSVAVSGTSPFIYQWYTGSSGNTGAPIGGATNSAFTVAPAATTSYWVRISNGCSSIDSNTATVTVKKKGRQRGV